MNKGSQSLKVYYEDSFWVGIIERRSDGLLEVFRMTFISEPKEPEIYELVQHMMSVKFSPSVEDEFKQHSGSFKHRLKESRREMKLEGIGTKSQQAMKLKQQQEYVERKSAKHASKDELSKMKYEIKREKRKKKQRGR